MRHIAPNTIRARLSPARLSAQQVARRGWQIGPRIRIGGTVGQIGQNVKNAVTKGATDIAHAAGNVATNPLVLGGLGLLTGGATVPLLAGAAGGLLKPGGNLGGAVSGAVQGGLAGMTGAKLGPLVRSIPGAGSVLGGVGAAGGALPGMPDVRIPGAPGGMGDMSPSSGGGFPWEQVLSTVTGGGGSPGSASGGIDWGSLLGDVGGFVKDNGLDLAMAGLATAQGVNAAKASQRAGNFQDKAINLAEQNWAAGAPLRSAGTTRLLTPQKANLAPVYTDPTNPFAPRVRRVA